MADVVMGLPRRDPRGASATGARALRLHLTLLIDAEDQRMVGGIEIQLHDVANCLHNCGAADSLNVFRRCAWRPNVRRMRKMVDLERPPAPPSCAHSYASVLAVGPRASA